MVCIKWGVPCVVSLTVHGSHLRCLELVSLVTAHLVQLSAHLVQLGIPLVKLIAHLPQLVVHLVQLVALIGAVLMGCVVVAGKGRVYDGSV